MKTRGFTGLFCALQCACFATPTWASAQTPNLDVLSAGVSPVSAVPGQPLALDLKVRVRDGSDEPFLGCWGYLNRPSDSSLVQGYELACRGRRTGVGTYEIRASIDLPAGFRIPQLTLRRLFLITGVSGSSASPVRMADANLDVSVSVSGVPARVTAAALTDGAGAPVSLSKIADPVTLSLQIDSDHSLVVNAIEGRVAHAGVWVEGFGAGGFSHFCDKRQNVFKWRLDLIHSSHSHANAWSGNVRVVAQAVTPWIVRFEAFQRDPEDCETPTALVVERVETVGGEVLVLPSPLTLSWIR